MCASLSLFGVMCALVLFFLANAKPNLDQACYLLGFSPLWSNSCGTYLSSSGRVSNYSIKYSFKSETQYKYFLVASELFGKCDVYSTPLICKLCEAKRPVLAERLNYHLPLPPFLPEGRAHEVNKWISPQNLFFDSVNTIFLKNHSIKIHSCEMNDMSVVSSLSQAHSCY